VKAGSALARKGREFQQEVACEIARGFGGTVEALVPRAVGKVVQGVRYVAEHDGPDLRVRTSGAAGPDVVPLSARAAEAFSFMVACKIWGRLPNFWPFLAAGSEAAFWRDWVDQAYEHCRGGRIATARL
jgi:hypothetical protein